MNYLGFCLVLFLIIYFIIIAVNIYTKVPENGTFYPFIYLTNLEGTISYFDLLKNRYILVIEVKNEPLEVYVYSKSNKSYKIGDKTKIINYSDGLYFIE